MCVIIPYMHLGSEYFFDWWWNKLDAIQHNHVEVWFSKWRKTVPIFHSLILMSFDIIKKVLALPKDWYMVYYHCTNSSLNLLLLLSCSVRQNEWFRTIKHLIQDFEIVLKWWDNFNFLVRILDSLPCLATIFYILQCLIMPCNNSANRTISQIQHVCDTQIWFTRFSHFDNILLCYIRQLLPLGHFHPNLQNNT